MDGFLYIGLGCFIILAAEGMQIKERLSLLVSY